LFFYSFVGVPVYDTDVSTVAEVVVEYIEAASFASFVAVGYNKIRISIILLHI